MHRLPVASSRDIKGGNLWLGWTHKVLGLSDNCICLCDVLQAQTSGHIQGFFIGRLIKTLDNLLRSLLGVKLGHFLMAEGIERFYY